MRSDQHQPCLIPLTEVYRLILWDLCSKLIGLARFVLVCLFFMNTYLRQTGQTVRPPTRISISLQICLILIVQSGSLFYHTSHFDTLFRLNATVLDIVLPDTLPRL